MHTHKSAYSFIGRTQKTAKTECGKTVKTSAIAIDTDCTCPGCIDAVDKSWQSGLELLEYARANGTDVTKLQASLIESDPRKYHTTYFL